MKNNLSSWLWGGLFIVAGVGFVGNAFDLWNFQLFFRGWWTLFIIIPSAVSMFQNGIRPFSLSSFVVGVLLLLSCLGVFDYHIIQKLIFPIILILIGASIILRGTGKKGGKRLQIMDGQEININDNRDYAAVFSSQTVVYKENEVFTGATLNSIFGCINMDLRSCIINDDVVIECSSVFGGSSVFVPKDVNVKVTSTPIFGGVSNKTRGASFLPGAPTVYINAVCMFGGVEIK